MFGFIFWGDFFCKWKAAASRCFFQNNTVEYKNRLLLKREFAYRAVEGVVNQTHTCFLSVGGVESITLIFSGCSRPLPRCAEEGLFSGTWIVWRTLWCRRCRTQPPWVFFFRLLFTSCQMERAPAAGAAGFVGVLFPAWGLFISQCDGVFEVHLLPALATPGLAPCWPPGQPH